MTYYEYDEPVPGVDAEGQAVTCTRTVRMSELDIINSMRAYLKERYPEYLPQATDEVLLNDFIVAHWARKVTP
ncbi:MAG: hypothetical protein ACRCZI_11480 [Cetobacterium sp.]